MLEASHRLGVTYYALRIGCFGVLLYFTFAAPEPPLALLSWMCLGGLFGLDFFWKV